MSASAILERERSSGLRVLQRHPTPDARGRLMTDQQPKRRARKIKAILAGGLVLGVGGAITLAAWNDSEFATGTFTAGQFNLEGSTDNTTWDDHDAAPGAALDFTLAADNLSPDDVVYAAFAVRLDAAT